MGLLEAKRQKCRGEGLKKLRINLSHGVKARTLFPICRSESKTDLIMNPIFPRSDFFSYLRQVCEMLAKQIETEKLI